VFGAVVGVACLFMLAERPEVSGEVVGRGLSVRVIVAEVAPGNGEGVLVQDRVHASLRPSAHRSWPGC